MSPTKALLNQSLDEALAAVRQQKITIFTIAFYHDHESRAVSICVDTEANSYAQAASSNRFFSKYFWEAVSAGDLKEMRASNANLGRNLSLGDFTLVNAGRHDLPKGKVPKSLYLEMIQALREREDEIVALAVSRERLLFGCSGPNEELDFLWCAKLSKA
jgi:hypothetical protein